MHKKTGPWSGSEYRQLHAGNDAETTALKLGRDVEEVRRKIDVSFDDWYRRHRCPGSPERPAAVRKIAWRIFEEDGFYAYITEGELEDILLKKVRNCFEKFDPSKWRDDVAVEQKFVRFFAVSLRRRLETERKRALERRARTCQLLEVPGPRDADLEIDGVRRALFQQALARLEPRARQYVRLRFLDGLTVTEAARRIGVGTQQLYNQFSFKKMATALKEKVREVVSGWSEDRAAALVGRWHEENGWSRGVISGLLCIEQEEVDRLLARRGVSGHSRRGGGRMGTQTRGEPARGRILLVAV